MSENVVFRNVLVQAIDREGLLFKVAEILDKIEFTKRTEIPRRIIEAQEAVARISGYAILPAPKWTLLSAGYKPSENISYINLFLASVASDIRTYANIIDGDLWLESVGKSWLIEVYKDRILTTFDYAYRKWREKQKMTREEVIKSRSNAIDKYNKIFRECNDFGHGIFFSEDLEKICS